MTPEIIKKFVNIFSSLPSIGPRQATRLAFYLTGLGKEKVEEVAAAVYSLSRLKACSECFFVYSDNGGASNLCDICRDERRLRNAVMIIEKETDLISIEKTKKWPGRYLVLGEAGKDGSLSNIGRLRLNILKLPPKKEEIVIAVNHTAAGDVSAALIAGEIKPFAEKITRLGRGLPTGGEIEFADEETLGAALERRN